MRFIFPGEGLLRFIFSCPTWHGPDFTCNFPQTVLRLTETDQSQIYPKILLCFGFHLLVNISRCSSQHLSVISSKHCLCLQLELRPTGTVVRPKNPDYLGLKTQTLPDHSLKNVRWVEKGILKLIFLDFLGASPQMINGRPLSPSILHVSYLLI